MTTPLRSSAPAVTPPPVREAERAEVPPAPTLPPETRAQDTLRDRIEVAANTVSPLWPRALIGAVLDAGEAVLTSEADQARQEAHVATFTTMVGEQALVRLDAHRGQVDAQRARLLGPGGRAAREQLRSAARVAQAARRHELVAKADAAAGYVDAVAHPLETLQSKVGAWMGTEYLRTPTGDALARRAQAVEAASAEVRRLLAAEPALGALDLATIDLDMSDAELEAALSAGLDEAEAAIDDVQRRILSGDISPVALGKLVQETLQAMGISPEKAAAGDARSRDVLKFLAHERNAEDTVNFAIGGVTAAVSVAGFLLGGPLGGGLVLTGAGVGGARASVELEAALDEQDAAHVGLERDAGLADEDEADRRVITAGVGLALSAADAAGGAAVFGAAVKAGKAAKAIQVAEAVGERGALDAGSSAVAAERAAVEVHPGPRRPIQATDPTEQLRVQARPLERRPVRPTDPTDQFPAHPAEARAAERRPVRPTDPTDQHPVHGVEARPADAAARSGRGEGAPPSPAAPGTPGSKGVGEAQPGAPASGAPQRAPARASEAPSGPATPARGSTPEGHVGGPRPGDSGARRPELQAARPAPSLAQVDDPLAKEGIPGWFKRRVAEAKAQLQDLRAYWSEVTAPSEGHLVELPAGASEARLPAYSDPAMRIEQALPRSELPPLWDPRAMRPFLQEHTSPSYTWEELMRAMEAGPVPKCRIKRNGPA
jgi:hypothetical protein